MKERSILIVEDESIVALDLKLQLQELGYVVSGIAASADQALALARRHLPNLVLMDVRLQGAVDGIEAATALRRESNVPVIFLTSHSDTETVARAARAAPYGYLTKPYQIKELRAGIEVALTKAHMERKLRESDRWFAHTLNCVLDGVVVTELDQTVRFLNPAAEALTGWSLDDAVGQDVQQVVCLWDAGAGLEPASGPIDPLHRVLQTGQPRELGMGRRLKVRDRDDAVVDASAGPVDDDRGQRLGAVLVLRDARPRLAQEARLRASEARFRNAFDHAPLGMAMVSLAGDFIQVNDAMCRLLDSSAEELRARGHLASTHADDREHELERLHALRDRQGGLVQYEKRYVRKNGGVVWSLVSVSSFNEADSPSCYLYQVHDLTEQKAAAEQLAELANERMRREASEMANHAKSQFLSRVSHEMRTPLNAVMGFAQLLKMQGQSDSATAQQYAEHILQAGQHLLAMVTDLLDMQRAAQGSLKLKLEPVAVIEAVDTARQFLHNQALAQNIALEVEIPVGLQVRADPVRLRQVLLNIGSNAVKYNRPGGTVRFAAEMADPERIRIWIQDSGIGMTEEQLARLFQPFDRLGQERTATPGVGLGMVIARDLMTEMGGSLEVSSRARGGTRVTLTIPCA